jgi:hypothetical protein
VSLAVPLPLFGPGVRPGSCCVVALVRADRVGVTCVDAVVFELGREGQKVLNPRHPARELFRDQAWAGVLVDDAIEAVTRKFFAETPGGPEILALAAQMLGSAKTSAFAKIACVRAIESHGGRVAVNWQDQAVVSPESRQDLVDMGMIRPAAGGKGAGGG